MNGWTAQYQRMRRWYDRFKAMHDGQPHRTRSAYMEDDVRAFFEACLHLRDWIANDDSSVPPAIGQTAFAYVKGNKHLSICRDIAIGQKHLRVDQPITTEDPELATRKKWYLSLDEPADANDVPIIAVRFVVETNSGPIDAFDLATECVTAWDDFCKQHPSCLWPTPPTW